MNIKINLAVIGCIAVLSPTWATPIADYVQDGLIAQWDGIDNAATGTHVASTNRWTDLVAGREFVMGSPKTFTATAASSGERPTSAAPLFSPPRFQPVSPAAKKTA